MGKTQKLRDKDGNGIKEVELKVVKKNNGLEKQTKMKPFTKKERI
jgi:hypothetical protein